MRISSKDTIAGIPALKIRELLRRADFFTCNRAFIEHVLEIGAEEARIVEAELLRAGYIEPDPRSPRDEMWQVAELGLALAAAKASPPVRRTVADRNLAELLERVAGINATADYAHLVERIIVFGSYLSDVPTVGDVDVAFGMRWRLGRATQPQLVLEERRRRIALAAGRSFSTYVEQLMWPEHEVILALKGRSRVVALHEIGQHEALLARVAHRIVYDLDRDGPAPRPLAEALAAGI